MATQKVICTSECPECIHCTLDNSKKSKVLVQCGARNKTYIYGQNVPCDDKVRRYYGLHC